MRPEKLKVVFNKQPPSAKGKYRLTLNQPYPATLIDDALALYQLEDDVGTKFNVSVYGVRLGVSDWGTEYTNGGYWYAVEE